MMARAAGSVVLGALLSCAASEPPAPGGTEADRTEEPTYIQKGYVQEPLPGSAPLPSPPPPLLSDAELEAARRRAKSLSIEEHVESQRLLSLLVGELAVSPDRMTPDEWESAREELRKTVIREVRNGRLSLRTAAEIHRDYLYPNDPRAADRELKGQLVLLTGKVVPHNVPDFTDPYKLYTSDPYVQDPVLFQTDFDLSFVTCHLLRPERQKLADWQQIHVLGTVKGKVGSDVVLRRCVVM